MVMKNLKSNEVIHLIQRKVSLKKQLREFKANGEEQKTKMIELLIQDIEDQLQKRPLSKNL